MAERKPGSNLGRAAIDWEAAFLYYASLPGDLRSYHAVADHYSVSVRTVERHGRVKGWAERARAVDRTAAELASERIRDERAEALVDTEKLIAASMLTYATQLRSGNVQMKPADVARLHKLRNEIWEQTDNTADPDPYTVSEQARIVDSPEYKLEVMRALIEAGILEPPTPTADAVQEEDDGDREAAA